MDQYNIDLCYRVRELRNYLHMNQTEFGEKIDVAQGYLTNIETAKRPVTDKIFKIICLQSWNGRYINEDWLRTGKGEPFPDVLPEDEIAAAISNVLDDIKCENSVYVLIKEFLLKYEKLEPDSKNVIQKYIDDVLNGFIERKGGK